MDPHAAAESSAARCVARRGAARVYVHPEGECACFRGGPAPLIAPTALDQVLALAPGHPLPAPAPQAR